MDLYIDIAAGGLRIGAGLVRCFHKPLRRFGIEAGQAYLESCLQHKTRVVHGQVYGGVYRYITWYTKA